MDTHYLEWRQGGQPRRMALRKKELFVGRRSDSDIVLTDPYVSRRHARLIRQDRGYQVIDLNSTHGTFVNGSRVQERVLEAGDKIRMGPGPSEFSYLGSVETDGKRTLSLEESVLQLSAVLPPVASAASELEKISHILDFQYQWGQTFSADRMLGSTAGVGVAGERGGAGFLLTFSGQKFDYVVGMDHRGEHLSESEFSTSRTVVEQVGRQGESLFMTEGIDQEFAAQESIVNMRLRAVACMPLKWISGRRRPAGGSRHPLPGQPEGHAHAQRPGSEDPDPAGPGGLQRLREAETDRESGGTEAGPTGNVPGPGDSTCSASPEPSRFPVLQRPCLQHAPLVTWGATTTTFSIRTART